MSSALHNVVALPNPNAYPKTAKPKPLERKLAPTTKNANWSLDALVAARLKKGDSLLRLLR